VESGSPVLGRPSVAAASSATLRRRVTAADAAFRADGGDGEWCALRAASVAGVRHRLSGQPVEDSFAWGWDAERVVAAVADGLGGVPGSSQTAGRVVEAAVEEAMAAAGPLAARLGAGLRAANEAARGGGASTIVMAVLSRDGFTHVGRVGDSTAFVVGEDGATWRELFTRPADDVIVNSTAALPADEVEPELTAVTLSAEDLLVLATDGVADPWRDGPATVAPTLSGSLARHPGPLELAQLVDFSRQGCHDDRTVLAIWLAGQAAGRPGEEAGEGGKPSGRLR
jgi:serine/threonine protein phosphatase PrpC